jgi:hypothetical protein
MDSATSRASCGKVKGKVKGTSRITPILKGKGDIQNYANSERPPLFRSTSLDYGASLMIVRPGMPWKSDGLCVTSSNPCASAAAAIQASAVSMGCVRLT